MHIFRFLQGGGEPVFTGDIHICLKAGRRHGFQQLSLLGQKGYILHIVLVIVIEKGHLAPDGTAGQVRVLDDTVVQGIRQLHHGPQVILHGPGDLINQYLVLLPDGGGHLARQPGIQGNAYEYTCGQGRQCKVDEYDIPYTGLLQLNPLLLKQHVPCSFTLPALFPQKAARQTCCIYFAPLNLVGETPKRFLNT